MVLQGYISQGDGYPAPVLVNPGAGDAGNGFAWGELFPQELGPRFELPSNLVPMYADIDTRLNEEDIKNKEFARLQAQAAAESGHIGEAPDDKVKIWHLYGMRRIQLPYSETGGRCVFVGDYPVYQSEVRCVGEPSFYDLPISEEFWHASCPNPDDLSQALYTIPLPYTETQHRTILSGPDAGQTNQQGLAPRSGYVVLKGYVEDGEDKPPMPITPPEPPVIPSGLPIPGYVSKAQPPALNPGEATVGDPGTPPTITLRPEINGSYTPVMRIPDCPTCIDGADGEQGPPGADGEQGPPGADGQDGKDGNDMRLEPMFMKVPEVNQFGEPVAVEKVIHVPCDGFNDMGETYQQLFRMMGMVILGVKPEGAIRDEHIHYEPDTEEGIG